jgi:hypothetical protein
MSAKDSVHSLAVGRVGLVCARMCLFQLGQQMVIG